jgi:hypothetical protein
MKNEERHTCSQEYTVMALGFSKALSEHIVTEKIE